MKITKTKLKETIKEGSQSWSDSLKKIASEKSLKSLTKKDRETLKKIVKLMKKSNENTELTKSKLKEMVRKEIKSLNEKHPHDDEAFLDIIQKAEDFGKAFSKYAHGSSQEYTKDANRIIGKSLKQYNKFNDHLKALYKELLKQ